MDKIKNQKQLREEQHRLEEHQEELEHKIKHDWKELKEGLKPRNAGRSVYNRWKKWRQRRRIPADIVAGSVLVGAALLVGTVLFKGGRMVGRLFSFGTKHASKHQQQA
jgi:hypothetical protein